MNSVYATYEDISDCWPIFKHNVEGFFPLRNVYKGKTVGSSDVNTLIRKIPIINLKFVPLKAELLAHKSILNLNERPYLHIFIGFCEDIDMYRQNFRPKLKSWLEAVSMRKTHQYIVILIEDQTFVHDNFKNNKTFLLDKIRFDFNDKVSLKLISLKLMPEEILSTIPECINIISDSIYHSTIMNLNQIDEDIRKLATQQNNSDWNFFTFFLTKESKAMAQCDLGLFSEALACYDELETLFLDINVTDYASKFECLLPFDSTISGLDLSPTNWIKFRELIHQNRISLYEFRVYLLSRQIHILKELKGEIQILLRCKEFVCQSIFIEKVDDNTKSEWIFGVIFFVLKIIDFDSIKTENREDLSNLLAEVLTLAEAQITFNLEDVNGDNFMENLSDLSQLMTLSYPLRMDKMYQFKISALRYCCKILKNTPYTHKQLIISLRLSDLYYKMKMFNIALEVLQESSDQYLVKNWPLVQIVLMEKACNCYWNLSMQREYIRIFFEIILIKGSQHLINQTEFDKINEAAFSLDDILTFNYDNFFFIKDLSTDLSNDSISLNIVISSEFKLPFKEYQIELTLSGETEDVIFNSPILPTIFEGNVITSRLLCKNEYSEGIHKIKCINIKIGKVEFKSKIGSDIWRKDIDLLATSYLHIEAIVPKNFNFSSPFIIVRCQNDGVYDVENLTLEVAPSDLDLSLSPEADMKLFIESSGSKVMYLDKLACKTYLDARYNISNYISGRHIIRVFSTHKRNENNKLKTNHFMEMTLPKPWTISRFDFNYKNIDIYCLEISPDLHSENINILSLGTDVNNQLSDFNFEIDKINSTLNISGQLFDELNDINVTFLQNEMRHFITVPVDKLKSDLFYCKCIPVIEAKDIKIGIPITFKVTVNNCEKLGKMPYSIYYDNSHWLVSGASNGYIKNTWFFEIVPISLGLLQLPTVVLLTTLPIHMITAGSTIFVTL